MVGRSGTCGSFGRSAIGPPAVVRTSRRHPGRLGHRGRGCRARRRAPTGPPGPTASPRPSRLRARPPPAADRRHPRPSTRVTARRPQPVQHPVEVVVVVRRHHEQQHDDRGARPGARPAAAVSASTRRTPPPAAAPGAPRGTARGRRRRPANRAGRRGGEQRAAVDLGQHDLPLPVAHRLGRPGPGPQGAARRGVEQRPGTEDQQHRQRTRRATRAAAQDRDHQPALADAEVQHLLQPGHGRAGRRCCGGSARSPGRPGRRPPPPAPRVGRVGRADARTTSASRRSLTAVKV